MAMLKKIGLIILPFILLYVICGYLYTGSPVENIGQRFVSLFQSLGETNFWLTISEYWNDEVLPAWNVITTGGDIFEYIKSILFILTIPISFGVTIIGEFFTIIDTLFRFITFQPLA